MKNKMISLYAGIQAAMSSKKGQGMVEYALLLVFAVVIVTTVYNASGSGSTGLKGALQTAIQRVTDALTN